MSNRKSNKKYTVGRLVAQNSNIGNDRKLKHVLLYCDGSCSGNPGAGGYGVILKYGNYTKEFHGCFQYTTNNRMEIMGVIVGLQQLREKCFVTVITDSKYVVDTMNKHWKTHKNVDLWETLIKLVRLHKVEFKWIKGHNGNPENERCDYLARLRDE